MNTRISDNQLNFADTNAEDLLIDVVALSKKLCAFPIQAKLAYASRENFLGRMVDGYSADADDIGLLTKEAAHALCNVQNDLNQKELGLFIFDAYRPHRAVRDFGKWFQTSSVDDYEIHRKYLHYPHITKADLAPLGYAHGSISNHNFGNTVDLMLISTKTAELLDMGACFDYFDERSHLTTTAEEIGEIAFNNRLQLVAAMQQHNFISYEKEFWHFSYYKREIDVPMDLPIVAKYRGWNVDRDE